MTKNGVQLAHDNIEGLDPIRRKERSGICGNEVWLLHDIQTRENVPTRIEEIRTPLKVGVRTLLDMGLLER